VSALAQAEHYRSRHGWGLLPLHGKEPHFELIWRLRATRQTRSFWKRAADLDEIHKWFGLDPETNIGVCLGEVSDGLAVLDQDTDPPAGVLVPMTALVKTGRPGGFQSYFKTEKPVRTRSFAWGELRGEGSYVAAPPSLHPNGSRYRWILDPETAGIAQLDALVLPREEPVVSREISPTCFSSVLLAADGQPLARVESDEAVATALAVALGITVPLGRSFRCVLHADRRASATLWRRDEGVPFLYHDWHRGSRWLSLALVRASLAGRPEARGPELATWKLRLLAEAGLVEPVPLRRCMPSDGLDEISRFVYERFLFLLGCRWLVSPGEPAPFTWRFAAAWCGLPARQTMAAFVELRRLGLVKPAGVVGRTSLWLPGGGDAMV
jgi:hypothetical protein